MTKFLVNSSHAESLADGSTAAPGDVVECDEENPHTRAMIDRGALVPSEEGSNVDSEGEE